ncbi:putative phosphatidate phosphatase isoform X2 [Parasteatoda tepidariorum]|uniref:putative phosphatidate phosphatase isoform X2 n=1 Tax=Parasteatoda tepidariorum TaxID=114398 RepID=UPI0039BD647E
MDVCVRTRNVTLNVCIDIILLTISLFSDYLKPYKRGFFCDDEDIMYPPKEERISDEQRWYISVFPPIAVIILVEFYRQYRSSNECTGGDVIFFFGWNVPYMFQRVYVYSGIFFFGIFMTEMINNTIKFLYGRLRPAFLAVCRPDFNCTEAAYPHFYVESFSCTNSDIDETNMRLSFPSGHAAFAAYSYIYVVLYLQKRLDIESSALLKPLIQFLFVLLTIFVTLSRIQDNRHHWDDVLCGNILGFFICALMIFTQTDLFKPNSPTSKEVSSQNLQLAETAISKSCP